LEGAGKWEKVNHKVSVRKLGGSTGEIDLILDMEGVRGSIPLPPTIHIKMLA
jgi:hypothetical protein